MRSIRPVLAFVIAALFLMWLVTALNAHSFYPKGCCSNKDCRPLTAAERNFSPDGWTIGKDKRKFETTREFRISPDRQWHACFYEHGNLAGRLRWDNKKPCVWAPEIGG